VLISKNKIGGLGEKPMRIIDKIKENVFSQDSDLLDRLGNEWHNINANFLDYYGQKDPERAFINIFTEEAHKKLPSCKVTPFVKLNPISAFSPEERAEGILGMPLEELRKKLCWPGCSTIDCRSHKCFYGEYPSGTEIDGLLIRGNDFCLLEYENSRSGICDNFMKIYRLRQLLHRQFESLFVTKVTTTRYEDSSTFESFNKYIDNIKPILDRLLHDWNILEIVDLSGSERKRRFHWRP
jgi:hypothetical protein